jgi:hypothetical protein
VGIVLFGVSLVVGAIIIHALIWSTPSCRTSRRSKSLLRRLYASFGFAALRCSMVSWGSQLGAMATQITARIYPRTNVPTREIRPFKG